MIRAFFKAVSALAGVACLLLPAGASAAIEVDPQKLYSAMKAAYDSGTAHGWSYFDQEYYLSTIFNAGRAYSLQMPDSPAYGELAQTAVDVASGLRWNPLTNHDAVEWYVREAAAWVLKNNPDTREQAKARDLLARADALEDPVQLANLANQDATANARQYPRNSDVLLQQTEAAWRSWILTRDPSWRELAMTQAAAPNFPIANLPTTWGPPFATAMQNAAHGVAGYTENERAAATSVLARVARLNPLRVIGNVRAQTHEGMLSTLAPADEYFGPMGMSILGIQNEIKRVNAYLDAGWGDRESGAAIQIAVSVDDLHKVYPRDRDLPALLFSIYKTLGRMQTGDSRGAAAHIRSILTVEYQDSPQAKQLLAS